MIVFGGIESQGVKLGLFAIGAVGLPLALKALRVQGRIGTQALVEAFSTGAKYALAVGAARLSVHDPQRAGLCGQ